MTVRSMAMVRFASFAVAAVVSLACGRSYAAEPTVAQYRLAFNQPAIPEIFANVHSSKMCRHLDCAAADDIALASYALTQRNHYPSPMNLRSPAPSEEELERIASGKIKRAILAHPRRLPAYCAILATMAEHFADYALAFNAIELALRLTRPDFDCLGPVIAALPRNEELEEVAIAKIRRLPLAHPRRLPAYCGILSAMARRFTEYRLGFQVIEVALRLTRDAIKAHTAEFLRAPSISRPRAFTPSKNERNSASSLHSTQ